MFVVEIALIGIAIALLPLSWVWFKGADRHDGRYPRLLWITVFLTLDLVMFGGFTRLTDSGLGCPDWPGCYGTASPFAAHVAIHAAQTALPSGPVTWMKAWIEMIHRYFATAIGVLIVALTVLGWRRHYADRRKHPARAPALPSASFGLSPWAPTVLLLLICVQGAFGAWTVTLKLQPVIVTTHLLLGLLLLASTAWVAASRTPFAAPDAAAARWQPAALVGLALLALQIALGGWVSTNYAVLACADFPTCNGQWVPPMDFAQGFHLWRALGRNGDGGVLSQDALVAIHWTHRTFAVVVVTYLGWLALRLRRFDGLRGPAAGLAALVALQFATGVSNIVLRWPLPVAVAHNGGAAAMLLLLTVLNFRIASCRSGRAARSAAAIAGGAAAPASRPPPLPQPQPASQPDPR